MTLASLFNDVTILGLFLVAGFVIRELVKPLQTYFVPASVIGGLLALIAGPQVLGLIEIPSSYSSMSGILVYVIMAALVFGVPVNLRKARSYLDYAFLGQIIYGFQLGGGVLVGILLRFIWKNLPTGWGCMGVFSFVGGHGTAATVGSIFQENGLEDNLGIGMILSTIGLVVAIFCGMILVNWGIRTHKAKYINEAQKLDPSFYGGLLPEEKRAPIGLERVSSVGINGIAFQFALLMLCYWLGSIILTPVKENIPRMSGIPGYINGILGAAIIWPIMCKAKLNAYVDRKTLSSISGFCLELVIVSAIATIRIDLLTKFWAPILIYSTIIIALTFGLLMYFGPRMCKDDWFEKICMCFGQATGNTSTGLALLRSADPDMQSSAGDSHGVSSIVFLPILSVFPAAMPLLCLSNEWTVVAIGLGMSVACMIVSRLLFWQKK